MDYSRLISRIAADKDSNRLGKIVRIESLIGKTVKKYKPYAMILVRKYFKKDVLVPVDVDKLIKVEGTYAWFNITKVEFDKEVKRLREIKTERDIYPGDVAVTRTRRGPVVDYLNLGHSRKERKR
ncbi:MAG: hypothetical protein E3J70_00100 [Candidatus Heimdallarchaeota archaeon]|nr:MAG: hypothetical protein E3J70_00100 [Candidatus Heimdallarchaeota archaeon]